MEKCWVKLTFRKSQISRREISEKIGLSAKNLIVKSQIGKKKLGGCLEIWHEKIQKWKKSGWVLKIWAKKIPKPEKIWWWV